MPFFLRLLVVVLVAIPAFLLVRVAVGPEDDRPDPEAVTVRLPDEAPGASPSRRLEARCEGELYPWFAHRGPELRRFCEPMPHLDMTVDARPRRLVAEVRPVGACAPLRPHLYLDGRLAAVGPWLGYEGDPKGRPRASGPIDLAIQPAGRHRIAVRMETEPGEGCATGEVRALEGWAAELSVRPEPTGAPLAAECPAEGACATSSTVAVTVADQPHRVWALLDLERPCGPLSPRLLIDGAPAAAGPTLGWPADPETRPSGTGWLDLGTLAPGPHTVAVAAERGANTCGDGRAGWQGRLHTRSVPVHTGAGAVTVSLAHTTRLLATVATPGCAPGQVTVTVDGAEAKVVAWPEGATEVGPLDLGTWPAGSRRVEVGAGSCAATVAVEAHPARKWACLRNRLGWYVAPVGLYDERRLRLDDTECGPQDTLQIEVLRRGEQRVLGQVALWSHAGALTVGPGPEVRTATSADAFTLHNRGLPPTEALVFALPLTVTHAATERRLDDGWGHPGVPGRWLEARAEGLASDQTFQLEGSAFGPTTFVCLRTSAGRFLSAEEFNPDVMGDRRRCQGWERLQLVDLDGPPLVAGDEVLIRAHRGTFLGDRPNGALRDDRPRAERWEVFVLQKQDDLPSDVLDTSGRQVSLRASHGGYVSVTGEGVVDARARTVGPEATFTLDLSPP